MTERAERIVDADGVRLCAEAAGNPADPELLLIHGMGASMDWWEDGFRDRLVAGGRYVIRYDHRDTGRSTSYLAGEPEYTGVDLAEDALRVLDGYGIARAHVLGMSMGGALTQLLTLDHPDRVRTITLHATTAIGDGPELPPPAPALMAHFDEPPPRLDWTDREAVLDYWVEDCRHYVGARPLDEAATRATAGRAYDRTANIASTFGNHARAAGAPSWRHHLGEITAPALVLHGTHDPLFPPAHGAALAAEIPAARLVTLNGTGHELTAADWKVVVAEVLTHTQR